VRLVDDQQADRRAEARQHLVAEARVVESLGADQEQVERVGVKRRADRVPFLAVGRIDRVRAQTQPRGRGELIAHQRQQRADDQRRADRRADRRIPQQRRGDEVDRRLAPPGPLHAEHPCAVGDDVADRLQLAIAKLRGRVPGERAQALPGGLGERAGVGPLNHRQRARLP
jgi:hypothetical protein